MVLAAFQTLGALNLQPKVLQEAQIVVGSANGSSCLSISKLGALIPTSHDIDGGSEIPFDSIGDVTTCHLVSANHNCMDAWPWPIGHHVPPEAGGPAAQRIIAQGIWIVEEHGMTYMSVLVPMLREHTVVLIGS